jgi:hypothetical protein
MTFNELMARVLSVLPDATLWQDNDGEICVSTKLTFASPVKVDNYGDEQLVPLTEEV